jgi:hypothetical protein
VTRREHEEGVGSGRSTRGLERAVASRSEGEAMPRRGGAGDGLLCGRGAQGRGDGELHELGRVVFVHARII